MAPSCHSYLGGSSVTRAPYDSEYWDEMNWHRLDQGLADTYSCPTCRRPLFMGSTRLAPPSDLQRSVDAPIAVPDLQAHDLQHLLTDASLQSPTHAVSEQPLSSPHWNNAPVTTSWT
jgi:autocrine motility factor receptor